MLPSAGEPDLALPGTGRPRPGALARRPRRTGQRRGATADLPRRGAVPGASLAHAHRAPGPGPGASFAPLERSLAPRDCGACHPAQYEDWRTSIHARSMGPGIAGQLVELARRDPAGARACLVCHAPLAEQSPLTRAAAGARGQPGLRSRAAARGRRVRDLPRARPSALRAPAPAATPRVLASRVRSFPTTAPPTRARTSAPSSARPATSSARAARASTASRSRTPTRSGGRARPRAGGWPARTATCRTGATGGAASTIRRW